MTYDPAVLLLSYGGQSRERLSRQLKIWRQFATGIDLTTDCEENHDSNTAMDKDGIIQKINLMEGEILEHVKEITVENNYKEPETITVENIYNEVGEQLEEIYEGPETDTVEDIYKEVSGHQKKIVRKFHRKNDCQKIHDGEKDSACHLLMKQGQ